jgi:hypothetical protein
VVIPVRFYTTSGRLSSLNFNILWVHRECKVIRGRLSAIRAEKTTFEKLAALYFLDYQINGRKTFGRAQELTDRLRESFGPFRARRITSDHTRPYIVRVNPMA